MDSVNVTIIGAGVVGLAIAAELSKSVEDVLVIEQHDSFGQETSSRNSEVIHSGIYYPQGSLKATLCVEGALMLYSTCKQYSIPFKQTGKLIVARDGPETRILEDLYNNGIRNNVPGLKLIDRNQIAAIGTNIRAEAAILSPTTGIIDSHSLMKHYELLAKDRGATISYNSKLTSVDSHKGGYALAVDQDDYSFTSRIVINSAGLSADRIASLAGIETSACGYSLNFCKGSYFHYAGRYPLPMLIYPVPHRDLAGLGVHATVDLGGRLRFGPDTEYVDTIDYQVDETKRDTFFASASTMFSGLEKEAFIPDMAGVRPKLSGPGEGVRDFVIADEASKGLLGFINLIGIESPGLTSAPAIAKRVAEMVISYF
jgi:L-2-hydroxyglutarate oxidase LhgO